MKSLSSNITAGMEGSSRPVYLIVIKPRSTDTWTRLAWATEAITLDVATGSTGSGSGTSIFTDANATFITSGVLAGDSIDGDNGVFSFQGIVQSVDSETQLTLSVTVPTGSDYVWTVQRTFDGSRIKKDGLGRIRQEIDVDKGGGIATVSDFEFEVLNQDNFFLTLPNYLENREIEVRLIFADKTGASIPNSLLLGKFIIEDVVPDLDSVRFTCIDSSPTKHKLIPKNLITEDIYTNAPKEILNRPVPLLWGSFTDVDSKYQEGRDVAKAYLIDRFDKVYVICDHLAKVSGSPYYFDQGLNQFCRFLSHADYNSFSGAPSNKAYYKITFPSYYRILKPWGTNSTYNDKSDWQNTADRDDTTYSSIDSNNSVAHQIAIPSYSPSVVAKLKAVVDIIGSMVNDSVQILIYDKNNNLIISRSITTSVDGVTSGVWTISNWTSDNPSEYVNIVADYIMWGTSEEATVNVKQLFIELLDELQNDIPIEIYSSAHGRMFGSWIDANSRNNGYNQNDLIENPAYIIESILRDLIGLDSSEINYQSFDEIGNTTNGKRNGWIFAFQILDQKNSLDIIDEICRDAQLIYFVDYQLKETIRELPLSGSTSVKSLSLSDYLLNGEKSSFKVERTTFDKIYNDFEVRYGYNYATQEYEKRVFCNKDGRSQGVLQARQDDCYNSYINYGFERKLVVESPYIRDDNTAIYLLSRLVLWFTSRKNKISFKTMLNGLDIELGDVITPYHPILFPSGDAVVTMIEYDLNRDLITFEARQL